MSYRISIMISIGSLEDCSEEANCPLINIINEWFEKKATGHKGLVRIDTIVGWQANVWAICTNAFSTDEFIDYILKLNWKEPETVQIFVKDEDDDVFAEEYRMKYLYNEKDEYVLTVKKRDLT